MKKLFDGLSDNDILLLMCMKISKDKNEDFELLYKEFLKDIPHEKLCLEDKEKIKKETVNRLPFLREILKKLESLDEKNKKK